jgi:hypothetical protein
MNYHYTSVVPKIRFLALIACGILLGVGCRTSEPSSASFASVVINGRSPDQICKTAGAVFQENGYRIGSLNPSAMMFQREASRGQSLAYGGVADTYYGSTTVVRVKAALVDLGGGSHRLQCNAFMVRNANDSFFQDESPLLNIRSGPYQALLNEVAKRLKQL